MNTPVIIRGQRDDALLTRDMTMRSIQCRAASVNETTRTVDAVLTSERAVRVLDMRTWEDIDEVLVAAGGEFPDSGLRLLDTHHRYSTDDVRGSVRNFRREIGQDGTALTIGTLHFAHDARSEDDFRKIKDGHITDVSLGYAYGRDEYVDIGPGESATVAGRTWDNRNGKRTLRVVTRWRAREVSLVPIGADEVAKLRAQSGSAIRKESDMNLRQYLESIGLRAGASEAEMQTFIAGLSGEQRTRATELQQRERGSTGTPPTPAPAPAPEGTRSEPPAAASGNPAPAPSTAPGHAGAVDADALRSEGRRLERERVQGIRALGTGVVSDELVEHAISQDFTVEQARASFLEDVRRQRSLPVGEAAPAGIVRNRGVSVDVLARGLLIGAGGDPMTMRQRAMGGSFHVAAADAARLPDSERSALANLSEEAYQYRSLSLRDLCREALILEGVSVPRGYLPDELARRAMSTSAMDGIFSAVINKRLNEGFDEHPDTTTGWVDERDEKDFRTNTMVALSKSETLRRLGPGGKARDMEIGDEPVETYKIARYAEKVTVDETVIIDDDVNVIMELPFQLGEAARRVRPDLVYAFLLLNGNTGDGVALFEASTHVNLTTAALSSAALDAAATAMAKQTQSGVSLNIKPKTLVVPPDLSFTARKLLRSIETREGLGGSAAVDQGVYNPIRDMNLDLVVDNRIGAAGVIDPASEATVTGSATNWFLMPERRRPIVVGYRRGTGRRPIIRSYVLTEGEWGRGWDINFDIGVGIKAGGWRSAHKSTGAG